MAGRKYQTSATLDASGITIGAVGIKDNALENYARVHDPASILESDQALAVFASVLGLTTGAALDADGPGTIQQFARSLFKAFLARTPNPGVSKVCDSAVVSCAAGSDNTLIAASPGKIVRVYRLMVVVAGDTTVLFKCGSTAKSGAMSLKANGSIVLDYQNEPWYVGAAGEAFVMTLGSAVQASGTIWYTQV